MDVLVQDLGDHVSQLREGAIFSRGQHPGHVRFPMQGGFHVAPFHHRDDPRGAHLLELELLLDLHTLLPHHEIEQVVSRRHYLRDGYRLSLKVHDGLVRGVLTNEDVIVHRPHVGLHQLERDALHVGAQGGLYGSQTHGNGVDGNETLDIGHTAPARLGDEAVLAVELLVDHVLTAQAEDTAGGQAELHHREVGAQGRHGQARREQEQGRGQDKQTKPIDACDLHVSSFTRLSMVSRISFLNSMNRMSSVSRSDGLRGLS